MMPLWHKRKKEGEKDKMFAAWREETSRAVIHATDSAATMASIISESWARGVGLSQGKLLLFFV